MKKNRLVVLVLSFALSAGCSGGGSESADNGGVSGGCCGTNPTTTVSFAFNNFTGVSVSAPFVVSIVPGPFAVQVTVDSNVVDLLDVREDVQILEIGFAPGNNVKSETNKVEIVMPILASISLAHVAVATISGFSGSVLDVQLAEVSTLEGLNLSYDLLMADADAVSVLLMEDVSPLPAAAVNVSDISSATVNMMDNGVLTGTATTTSSISYYGSDVSISVVTDLTSSITRLGESRP
jgi:hypothetical protein